MVELVRIESNDSHWSDAFNREKAMLEGIMRDEIQSVHHIGSTAIPGTHAKPIVDILVVVRDIDRIDSFNHVMQENSFEPFGEHGNPGRRFFVKRKAHSSTGRTSHIHIFQAGHTDVDRHINFRDYLIAHPDEAKRYEALKMLLAQTFSSNRVAYTDGKSEFIRETDKRASRWKAGK